MNNKKLARLLEPNLKLYFFCLGVFVAAAVAVDIRLALAEAAISFALYAYFRRSNRSRNQNILQYIDSVTDSVDTASKSTLIDSPLPIMVFRPDTGEIIWSNEDFLRLANVREHLFELKVEDAVPTLPVQWLLERKTECPERVVMNGRRFQVYGNLVRAKGRSDHGLVATTYWVDTTESDTLKESFASTRPILALIAIDNYDELMKACADTARSAVLAQIDEKLSEWASIGNGLLLKTSQDHYLFLFESQYYSAFIEEKFSVLDVVREIKVGDTNPTLSIGIGTDVPGFSELYKNANLSLEMALSRGGDQAVIRTAVNFEFYGGKTKSAEKRTKVKSRVMANALRELMNDAGKIYVMGHTYADMDLLGAAAGICCAARRLGKDICIVIDSEHTAASAMLAHLQQLPEYAGKFVHPDEAFLKIRSGALLVVVDTNRPDMVESPQLLDTCTRIAVIDHHRRAANYIENAAFSFHEPYASSASELVTELLQYMVDPTDLLREEAECLLAGIVLDTKHFTQRTGGRTFEAAAFLRRAGADTADVQLLFQNSLSDMISRYSIIRQAELYRDDIAIATVDETHVDRIAAAQAADELLTLKGVRASFVLYRNGNDVLISARSLGDINVQFILETLGGGGNSTTAGSRIENGDIQAVHQQLLDALHDYFAQ